MLKFEDVSLGYAGETVLDRFSLHVRRFDKAVIRGVSGSGKTTVINLLLGFLFPDAGRILWKGTPVSDETVAIVRSSVAWLPQDFKFGTGSVRDVIRSPFRFRRNRDLLPEDKAVTDILQALNLPESILAKNFPDISEGQKQRIGLTVCLLLKRELLLLDEPTSSLDPESKQRVMDLFLGDENLTVLSTSHDPEWAARCHHVIDLDR